MRSVTAAFLALVGASAAESPARPADIYFTSRATVVDEAAMKAAAKARQAEAARKAKELEQAYTAQYGKNQGQWPSDKRAELSALRAGAKQKQAAEIESDYASASLQTLADSARDLSKGAEPFGGGLLRVVGRAEEADLVVEVMGQHSSKSEFGIAYDNQFGFILRLSAGGKLAEGRLHGAVVRWPEDEEQNIVVVKELHGYSDAEPYWLLRIRGGGGFGQLANWSIGILADFVRLNGSLFAGR